MTTTALVRQAFRRHGIKCRARDFSTARATRIRVVFDHLYTVHEQGAQAWQAERDRIIGIVNMVAGELRMTNVSRQPFTWSSFNGTAEVMMYRWGA